jgi:hypothetical protein
MVATDYLRKQRPEFFPPKTGPASGPASGPFNIRGGVQPPEPSGSHFATKGARKYVNPANRNLGGSQFNKPAVKSAAEDVVRKHSMAQYFRHAGMGAAIRYTLGIEQTPSHMSDYLNSTKRRQTGLDPRSSLAQMLRPGEEP